MPLSPIPVRTPFLEVDSAGKMTGRVSWPWLKWLQEFQSVISFDFDDLLSIMDQETMSTSVAEQVVNEAEVVDQMSRAAIPLDSFDDVVSLSMILSDTPRPSESASNFADDEAPTDSGDHLNFTLAHTPLAPPTLVIWPSGLTMKPGTDFTYTGTSVLLAVALDVAGGETMGAWYRY